MNSEKEFFHGVFLSLTDTDKFHPENHPLSSPFSSSAHHFGPLKVSYPSLWSLSNENGYFALSELPMFAWWSEHWINQNVKPDLQWTNADGLDANYLKFPVKLWKWLIWMCFVVILPWISSFNFGFHFSDLQLSFSLSSVFYLKLLFYFSFQFITFNLYYWAIFTLLVLLLRAIA